MKSTPWICFILSAAVLAIYLQVVDHQFLYFDDVIDVSVNRQVNKGPTLEGVWWALTTLEHANWLPLTRLSHIGVTHLFGKSAGTGLLVNVLLHLINSLLLFAALAALTGSRIKGALAAALFAVHPLHVESVAWLTERKDVLSGLFFISALWSYARYGLTEKRSFYLLTLLFFLMGLMSKPMVISLPIVLLLLDYWPLNRLKRGTVFDLVMEKVPFFALSVMSAVFTLAAHVREDALLSLEQLTIGQRIGHAALAYTGYLTKTLWPARLAAFYSRPAQLPLWEAGFAIGLLALVTWVCLRTTRHRFLAVGWIWFIVTLIPVIGLVNWGYHSMADRFTYLPLIGLFIALVWGVDAVACRWPGIKPVFSAGAVIALLLLTTASWHQVGYWRNFTTLFTHAVKASPNNWWAMFALGGAHAHEGRVDRAIPLLRRALEIRSDFIPGRILMGQALAKAGKKKEAVEHFDKALELDPRIEAAWIEKGKLMLEAGELNAAELCFRKALELNPGSATVHFSLGNLFYRIGRLEASAHHFSRSLLADPDAYSTHNNLAVVLHALSRTDDAIVHLKKALALKPGWQEASDNLARITSMKQEP